MKATIRPTLALGTAGLGTLVAVLGACGTTTADPADRLATVSQRVISGAPDSTGTYAAVARMSTNCSGVLIAPRVVLTSAHCFVDHATNCTTLAAQAINVTFADHDGTVASEANWVSRRRAVTGFALHPDAAFDLSGCPCSAVADHREAINHSREHMLLFLADDAPNDVVPLPVLLHPTVYDQVAAGQYAGSFGKFAGVETWGATAPKVTFIGTGIGTQRYTANDRPGRDIGMTRWRRTTSNFGTLLGMTSCTARVPSSSNHPTIGIVPGDIYDTDAPNGDWDDVTAGFDFAGTVHSHAGSGDSGGPVVLGAGPGSKGVTPTPLPAPASGDVYDVSRGYVAGNANLWLSSYDGRPSTAYAPTYTLSTSQFLANNLVDTDGDGYADAVDHFPGCDDGGPDGDGDGIPNACDPCPCDADNDADGDGFCAIVCPNHKVDLCPLVADSPFDNCNEAAENAHGATKLGDRCDPAICPSTTIAAATSGPDQQLPCPQSSSDPDQNCPPPPDGMVTWLNCNTYVRDELAIKPLASFGPTGTKTNGGSVGTSARFCQRNDTLGISCADPAVDFQDEQLDDFGSAPNAAAETKFSHFHRVSFASGGPSDPDQSGTLSYNASPTSNPTATWKWDFAADQARWLAADQIDLVPGDTPLIGSFWLHANTAKGGTIDIGQGTHGADMNSWFDAESANFVGGFSPQAFFCTSCGFLMVPDFDIPGSGGGGSGGRSNITAGRRYGMVSGTASPTPWLVWRPTATTHTRTRTTFRRPEASRHEASILWQVNERNWGAVGTNCGSGTGSNSGGTGQFVDVRLGTRLRAQLARTDLRWFNAAEPAVEYGPGPDFPLSVALGPNGDVVDTVYPTPDGARLLADADRQIAQRPRLNRPTLSGDAYAAVFSRMRRGVFVVGSRLPTGAPGGIWFTPLDGDRWHRIAPSGYMPEKVLAATYSFATKALYILDEVSTSARLVEVKLDTGRATVLGTFARHAEWSRHALVVETNGAILLASTNPAKRRHIVTRIDVRRAVGSQDQGSYDRASELTVPPVVDPDGYTHFLWNGSTLSRLREPTLRMTRAPGPTGRTDLIELGNQL